MWCDLQPLAKPLPLSLSRTASFLRPVSNQKVYAHYRPVAKRTPPALARKGSDRALTLQAAEPGREAEAVTVRERLSITCRLVKDFQQEIQLFAR